MLQVNTIDITNIVFHELVGDWSQEIHLCSYNDDSVLADIVSKTANDVFARAEKYAQENLNKMYPGVVDWQQLFDDLIALHKGWPEHYSNEHTPFKDLTGYHLANIKSAGREDLFELEMPT